jgi:hypothetical protein
LTQFFTVYDDWYGFSSKAIQNDGVAGEDLPELMDKMTKRDESRNRLITHLTKRHSRQ